MSLLGWVWFESGLGLVWVWFGSGLGLVLDALGSESFFSVIFDENVITTPTVVNIVLIDDNPVFEFGDTNFNPAWEYEKLVRIGTHKISDKMQNLKNGLSK